MQRALVLAWLLVACGGGATGEVDAGGPDPTSVMGTWSITWACVEGCTVGSINPLAYDDVLVVAGDDTASYASTTCADCGTVHAMTVTASCLAVPAGDDFGVARAAYQACSEAGVLTADLTWSGFPGPEQPRTYRLTGVASP